MSSGQFRDRVFGAAKAALAGLSRRQEVIANNVANIDTPGYKAKSLDFESALRHSMQSGGRVRLDRSDDQHILVSSREFPLRVSPRIGGPARADGNNVDIDVELMDMAETSLRFEAISQTVSKKLSLLRQIANGR